MSRRTVSTVYALILGWMFLPMVPVVIAATIAAICGADLDEGSVHPCILFGTDVGETLYTMAMMGWFGMLTFPTGILAMVVFTPIALLSRRIRRVHAQSPFIEWDAPERR